MNFDARPCALGLGAAALFMALYDLHYGLMAEAQLQALVFLGAGVWYGALKP